MHVHSMHVHACMQALGYPHNLTDSSNDKLNQAQEVLVSAMYHGDELPVGVTEEMVATRGSHMCMCIYIYMPYMHIYTRRRWPPEAHTCACAFAHMRMHSMH